MTGSAGTQETIADRLAAVVRSAGAEGRARSETAATAPTGPAPKSGPGAAGRWGFPRIEARLAAATTLALVVGAALGMAAAPGGPSQAALARIEAGLETGRAEAARLGTEIEGLGRVLTALRETGDTARGEGRTARTQMQAIGNGLEERLARLEQGLDRRFATLAAAANGTADGAAAGPAARAEPAPTAPMPPAEKRASSAPVVVATATPVAVTGTTPTAARPEPTQTASLPEGKPRPETIEAWAVRDVYDGVAMLEDRRRRLVEVAPGDSVPGIGRVEAIERRGRTWVVVTRQGLITPQAW